MVAPTREFTVSSLLTIGASTLVFGLALGYFVERGLLDREWASTTAFVQAAARAHLRPADFGRAPPTATLEAGDRFEEFARQVRMLPDVRRLVVHGRDNAGGVVRRGARGEIGLGARRRCARARGRNPAPTSGRAGTTASISMCRSPFLEKAAWPGWSRRRSTGAAH